MEGNFWNKKRKKQKWVSDGVEAALKGTQKRHTNWKTRNSLRPKTLIATHCMCVKKYCMNNSTIPNMTCGVKEAKPEMNVMKNSVSPRERCELFLLKKCAASWLEIPLFCYHDEFVNFSWDFHTSTEESERNWKSRLTFWKLWGQRRSWKVWAYELIMMYEDHVRESKSFKKILDCNTANSNWYFSIYRALFKASCDVHCKVQGSNVKVQDTFTRWTFQFSVEFIVIAA